MGLETALSRAISSSGLDQSSTDHELNWAFDICDGEAQQEDIRG